MVYYHGSNKKFTELDLTKSNGEFHVTPHKKYAEDIAKSKPGKSYLYFINIKGTEEQEYHSGMSNVVFRSTVNLELIAFKKL